MTYAQVINLHLVKLAIKFYDSLWIRILPTALIHRKVQNEYQLNIAIHSYQNQLRNLMLIQKSNTEIVYVNDTLVNNSFLYVCIWLMPNLTKVEPTLTTSRLLYQQVVIYHIDFLIYLYIPSKNEANHISVIASLCCVCAFYCQ